MPDFPFIPGKTTKAEALRIVSVRQQALDQAEAHDDADMPMLLICLDREPLGKLAMSQAVSLRNYLDEFVSEQLKAMHKSLLNRAAHTPPKRRPPGAPPVDETSETEQASSHESEQAAPHEVERASPPAEDFTDLPTVSLGQYLRTRRTNREKTQRDIERACDLPPGTMTTFENGRLIPTIYRLERLADHLDLSFGILKRLAERDLAIKNASATRIHRRTV